MKNNFICRIGKIALSQKLPDRFLSVKAHKPSTDKNQGSLYFLIEITSPWFPSTEIGKAIENSVISNFYNGQKYENAELRFEESIKKTNLILADLANKGETEWIGKLNAVIFAILDDTIYLTSCGNTKSFLMRNQVVKRLTEDDKSPRAPINTFSNIISGELEADDKMIFTNAELLRHLTKEQIQGILKSFDPITGVHEIAKILKKEKIKNINALVIETASKEKASFQPPAELSDTVYLDQKEDIWLEKALKKSKPVVNDAKEKLKSGWDNSRQKTKPVFRKTTIYIGKGVLATGRLVKSSFSNIRRSRREIAREHIKTGERPKEWQEFIGKSEDKSFLSKFLSVFINIFSLIFKQLAVLFTKQRKILIVIILVIVLAAGVIIIKNNISKPSVNINKLIQEAEAKENSAKSELAINNKNQARSLFIEAINILEPVKNDSKRKEEVLNIYSRIQNEMDQMDNIVRWQKNEAVFNLSAHDENNDAVDLVLSNGFLYASSKQNNKIYQFSINDFQVKKEYQISLQDGQIETSAQFLDQIAIKTNSSLYLLTPSSGELQKQNIQVGDWQKSIHIKSYSNNLYFLTPENNKIIKYSLRSSSWSSGQNAVSSITNLQNASQFTIDGYIYVLNNDGSANKNLSGQEIPNFSFTNLPPPLDTIKNTLDFKTSEESNSLYVFDGENKRIIEFDKEGKYIKQYILPNEIENLKTSTIDFQAKKIYILADNLVYKFDL